MCSDRYLLETCLIGQVGGLVVKEAAWRLSGYFHRSRLRAACCNEDFVADFQLTVIDSQYHLLC